MFQKVSAESVPAFVVLLAGLSLAGCKSADPYPLTQDIAVSPDIELHRVADNVWVHTTYSDLPRLGRYPANGLVVVDGHEAMLIDLPWTDEQTSRLLDWLARKWGISVTTVIPTHFHEDCVGGLSEAHRRGAVSHALDKTIALAQDNGVPVPQQMFAGELKLRCRKTAVIVTHLGAGHTIDNVVAWVPRRRVLFGGCLIKPLSAATLGNTRDANLDAYPITLRAVRQAYPDAQIVIPGHGDWGGLDLIDHTLNLCQNNNR